MMSVADGAIEGRRAESAPKVQVAQAKTAACAGASSDQALASGQTAAMRAGAAAPSRPIMRMTPSGMVRSTAWKMMPAVEAAYPQQQQAIRVADTEDVINQLEFDPVALEKFEDFSEATEAILQKYEAAMREMVVRFEILNRDISVRATRNPIHHIESRVKAPVSIYEKLLRYGKEPTLGNVEKYLMDVAGVRVIVSYINDAYVLADRLKRQDDLELVQLKDYIAHPKPNGYRSLHAIFRVPVYFADGKQMVPVEVQIRTVAMDYWASLEHELNYKADTKVDSGEIYDELKNCSTVIEGVEERMQALAKKLGADFKIEHPAGARKPDFPESPQSKSSRPKPKRR
jgi:putative GTP pyrophosphokinase